MQRNKAALKLGTPRPEGSHHVHNFHVAYGMIFCLFATDGTCSCDICVNEEWYVVSGTLVDDVIPL